MYLCSLDWLQYGYQMDIVYDNVILYVVYEDDVFI